MELRLFTSSSRSAGRSAGDKAMTAEEEKPAKHLGAVAIMNIAPTGYQTINLFSTRIFHPPLKRGVLFFPVGGFPRTGFTPFKTTG